MAVPLPKFDAPPVVETALSVQFARLPGYSSALVGWFWKSYLGKLPGGNRWSKASEAPRLQDTFERFGSDDAWGMLGFQMLPPGESQRSQISSTDGQRMVQIQDSRFILNWKKGESGYPSYGTLSNEFFELYESLRAFSADSGLGRLEPNQWEVTYVNRIERGAMWDSPVDWRKIIPSLAFPPSDDQATRETMGSDWRYIIHPNRGRLYISLRHARIPPDIKEEVLQLQLTARGPVSSDNEWGYRDGFELGHAAIVNTFAAMTSPEAHQRWRRRV